MTNPLMGGFKTDHCGQIHLFGFWLKSGTAFLIGKQSTPDVSTLGHF